MPRVCSICSHPQRPEIDRALLAAPPLAGETGVKLSDQRPTLKNPGTALRVRGV